MYSFYFYYEDGFTRYFENVSRVQLGSWSNPIEGELIGKQSYEISSDYYLFSDTGTATFSPKGLRAVEVVKE